MSDALPFDPPTPAMPGADPAPLDPNGPAPLVLADRGTRLGAKCLDGLTVLGVFLAAGLLSALCVPVAAFLHHTGLFFPGMRALFAGTLGSFSFLGTAGLVTLNCIWLHRYGQTVGKRMVRIRIVRTDGRRASLGRIFALRYLPMLFLGALPYLGILITLTDFLLIFRDTRKCLHDQFADTIVVKAD